MSVYAAAAGPGEGNDFFMLLEESRPERWMERAAVYMNLASFSLYF